MANSYPTTSDLLMLGDGNISDIDVTELLTDTPFLAALSAIESSNDTSHEWIKHTTGPSAGSRSVNDGVENTNSVSTKVTKALTLYDSSFSIDLALLKLRTGDALKRREAVAHLMASFVSMEKGLFSSFATEDEVSLKTKKMVVDATGSTASSATSVWAVRSGEAAVSAVYGGNARIELGEEYMTTLAGSATGVFDALRTPLLFWGGAQVSTTLDLGRIVNLTAQSGKGLTDALLGKLVAKFPAGRKPNMLVMNTASQEQLRASRTATSPTGAEAEPPETFFGIPIIVTDQITSTEAIVAAS